jgi:hypothetical protein
MRFFSQWKICEKSLNFFMKEKKTQQQIDIIAYFMHSLMSLPSLKNALLTYLNNKSNKFFSHNFKQQELNNNSLLKLLQLFFAEHAQSEQKAHNELSKAFACGAMERFEENSLPSSNLKFAYILSQTSDDNLDFNSIADLIKLQLNNGEFLKAKFLFQKYERKIKSKITIKEVEKPSNLFLLIQHQAEIFFHSKSEGVENNQDESKFGTCEIDDNLDYREFLKWMDEIAEKKLNELNFYRIKLKQIQLSSETSKWFSDFLDSLEVIYLRIREQLKIEASYCNLDKAVIAEVIKVVALDVSVALNSIRLEEPISPFRNTIDLGKDLQGIYSSSICTQILKKLDCLFELFENGLNTIDLVTLFVSLKALVYSKSWTAEGEIFANICGIFNISLDYLGIVTPMVSELTLNFDSQGITAKIAKTWGEVDIKFDQISAQAAMSLMRLRI